MARASSSSASGMEARAGWRAVVFTVKKEKSRSEQGEEEGGGFFGPHGVRELWGHVQK